MRRVRRLLLPVCLILLVLTGTAHAEDPAEEDLFQQLLAGKSEGEWRGILNRIRKEKDAAWIGQTLGVLFRDRAAYGDRADVAGYAAAYLADDAENGKVLLGKEILRRAYRDEAFLAGLRRHLTVGEGGWARLLDHGRDLLKDPQPRERAVGVWFLGREDKDQREAVRRDLFEQAKADLELRVRRRA